MQSCLSRAVFRRLLSERPLFQCPHQRRQAFTRRDVVLSVVRFPVRRTIFGFSQKPSKQIKSSNVHPGLVRMRDLAIMENVQARPPSPEELIESFNAYVTHQIEHYPHVIEDTAAKYVLRTFRHLRDTNMKQRCFGLTNNNLRRAQHAMSVIPLTNRDSHACFAREVYAELEKRNNQRSVRISRTNLIKLVQVLCSTGHSLEARELVEKYHETTADSENTIGMQWITVVEGLAAEDSESELLNAISKAEELGFSYGQKLHSIMTTFFASRNDVEQTKFWYTKPILPEGKPTAKTVSEILQFCIRNDETEWCKSVFRDLLEKSPDKRTWDIIFQWAAGALGKSVEDVEQMINVMVQNSSDYRPLNPDIETINGLVKIAMSKKNPYLAERYLALGFKSGILPNAQTFILQMDYRIDAGDISGAQGAYKAMQSEEVLNHEDLPVINKYLRALCSQKKPPVEHILSILEDLNEKHELLDAETIAALCILHFKRDDFDEALNTIQVHNYHIGDKDRAKIRDSFLAYCLDRNNSNMSAWQSYLFIKAAFTETNTEIRTQLMTEFFDRKRADMGYHVFGHMRQDIRPEMRPTSEIYIKCFESIAACADEESLKLVHNMMKLDSSIEPSTKLYNALMLGYTACEHPDRALDFWQDITISREGPTYESLEIVFKVCEDKVNGEKPAKVIWNQMRRMEIEVTLPVFNAYVGALARGNLIEEVKALIDGMTADMGFGPDMMTIGIFFNAAPAGRKAEVEDWARANYPEFWTQLEETVGQERTIYGPIFAIKRNMKV